MFIGIFKYYKDMRDKQSDLIHPLTVLTSPKVNFKWTNMEQKLFDDIKRTLSHNTLLAYPDFNKRFDIHTHYSD